MKLTNIANLVLYILVWFACVLGAANNLIWIGLLSLAIFVGWQLAVSEDHVGDIRLLGAAALAGLIVDTSYIQAGLLHYASPLPSPELAPWWVMALWLNFALLLNHSLRRLQDHPWLAMALGFVGGFIACYGGIRLNVLFLEVPELYMLLVFAAVWAVAIPALVWVARVTRVPVIIAEPVHLSAKR